LFALVYVYISFFYFILLAVRMFVVVFMFLSHRRLLVLSLEPCPSSSVLQFPLTLSCACLRVNWLIYLLTILPAATK